MFNNCSNPLISELIHTRISHDIIGNVGAVANAVELLEEGDTDFLDDITSILKASSFSLSSRLKFFRLAFGTSNSNLEQYDLVSLIVKDYLKTIGSQGSVVDFSIDTRDAFYTKLALLCVMIAGDTMIKGGKIEIVQTGNKLEVNSFNNGLVADKVFIIKEVLQGNINDLLPQYAPILYLKHIVDNENLNIVLAKDDTLHFSIC